ncbi:hypothetical protein [Streptomyces sp. NPDC006739]|uniref:hypothetical protein n=1 Tax=Streptomyces sp. NPDC006739 TaxID=3364763 RepID=UPI0036CCE90D
MSGADHGENLPETALEEALREITDAMRRDEEPARPGGEAADAITPNARAQEESRGEAQGRTRDETRGGPHGE